jgi:prenyltransferase beta subunit
MLQVARLASKMLGESTDCIRAFLATQRHAAGGYIDRDGNADLYYTVFGLDCQAALQEPITEADRQRHCAFIEKYADGAGLDFVHLCCLGRCRAALNLAPLGASYFEQLERFRTPDGGYAQTPGAKKGTAYAAFLAYGTYLECGRSFEAPHLLLGSLLELESKDGGYANEPKLAEGTTTATAAVIAIMSRLVPYDGSQSELRTALVQWFERQGHAQGGYRAFVRAPIPDLLSTATALHALTAMEAELTAAQKENCLDFIDTLWNASGGFHGHWADDYLDVEYTFYGLLSLGHLAVN